jgi:curved DNA-binding protein CbpA
MSMATTPKDAYAVLGVDPAADDEHIAAAYRTLARRFHPDIAGESATRRMMRINAAWDRLRDPQRRAAYDLELMETDPRRAAAARSRRSSRRRYTPPAHHAESSTHHEAPHAESAHAPHYEAPYQGYQRPRERDGTGAAGRPPGRPSGSVLKFGRHLGWSLGEIARVDPGYLVWLEERQEGKPYAAEIDHLLRRSGFRTGDSPTPKKGRFGR